jgi:hypothetical protein
MPRPWPPYRETAAPTFWEIFCLEWLALSRHEMQRWWAAVCRSPWSRSVTLRGTIRGHEAIDTQPDQVMPLYRDLLAPRALLAVIEDLLHQRLMTYRETCTIAEAILRRMDRHGQWKGASAGPAPLADVNAQIYAALEH